MSTRAIIARPTLPRTIRFNRAATRAYKATVAAHPPETYAVLGGDPRDRALVTDLRFVPAKKDQNGTVRATSTYVEPDMAYVNHILVKEWIPLGLTILGFIHSHPGSFNDLSTGGALSGGQNVGDIPAIKAHLAGARSAGIEWPYALMPITTFRDDGSDTVTGWIVTLDDPEPFPVTVLLDATDESQAPEPSPAATVTSLRLPLEAVHNTTRRYLDVIEALQNGTEATALDRQRVADSVRGMLDHELDALIPEVRQASRRENAPWRKWLGLSSHRRMPLRAAV